MENICELTVDISKFIRDELMNFKEGDLKGVKLLKNSLATSNPPNFDKFDTFIENVVKKMSSNISKKDVIQRLEAHSKLILSDVDLNGIGITDFVTDKVNSFWVSAPRIIDNTNLNVVNSSTQNVEIEQPVVPNYIATNKYSINNYYANPNYIKDFINNFRSTVNQQLFTYRDQSGTLKEVLTNQDLNKAIKLLKNKMANDIAKYLETVGITVESSEIFSGNTLTFNRTTYDNLIKLAESQIKSDNYFLNSTEILRQAFENLEALRNFDDYVKSYLKDSIIITKGYHNSHFEPSDGKYKIGNEMKVNNRYGDENASDIFNHTNESMRIYIESIPYFDSFSKTNKRISMNMFNSVFLKMKQSIPDQMVNMRLTPEESFIKILNHSVENANSVLEERRYFSDQLIGIHKAIQDLYNLQAQSVHNNNLYSMLANYVNKLTPINYTQSVWNNKEGLYRVEKLTNEATTRMSSDLEKMFQVNSKYNDFDINGIFSFTNDYIVKTNKGEYIIPFDGGNMTILSNNTILKNSSEIYDFIKEDGEFSYIINKVFGNKVDSEIFDIIYNSYNRNFMKIFNLMGNILLNNDFSQGTKDITGPHKVAENLEYFNNNNIGFKYKTFITNLVNNDPNIKDRDITKRIFNSQLGTLRVSGFNNGDLGRDVIYKAIADSNGDSTRSFVTGESGNMLPLTRLPNLINSDNILFKKLENDKNGIFFNNNIFSSKDLKGDSLLYEDPEEKSFNIAGDTQLKTTITNKDGIIQDINSLSTGDLLLSQIMFDYFGNSEMMYIQPVTYSDKSQIWLKGINRNKEFKYNDLIFKKGLGGASIQNIQSLHFQTMQNMINDVHTNIVNDYNLLFSYMNIPPVSSYEEAIMSLNNNKITEKDINKTITRILENGEKITIFPEIHYSKTKKGLGINETLQRNINLYNNFQEFKNNQSVQKKLWAYIAAKEGLNLEQIFQNGRSNNILSNFGFGENYNDNWIDKHTGQFILYKVKTLDGKYKDEIKINGITYDTNHYATLDAIKFNNNYIVELNPEIDRFIEIHSLVTNHYLAATVGMPYIHPAKTTFEEERSKLSNTLLSENEKTEATIRKMEAVRTAAHSKRMIIYGSTIHPFIQQKIDGIPENYNIACIDDKVTKVFNLQGNSKSTENYDGGMLENPLVAIWEKNSLPEISLSPIHRKSIMYMPNSRYMGSGLGKWAGFSFNNEMIRSSSSNNKVAVSGRELMKKMTDRSWMIPNLDITDKGRIQYSGYYYYDTDLKHNVRIRSIRKLPIELSNGKINNKYEVVRDIVDSTGKIDTNFNQLYKDKLTSQVSINSNFDLWTVLGGEFSMKIVDNSLDWSESSIEKVADIASDIKIRRSNKDIRFIKGYESYLSEIKELDNTLYNHTLQILNNQFPENLNPHMFTQTYYLQPMKHSDIHYVSPKSAIKNGYANMNSSEEYNTKNSKLNSWTTSSLHLGIVLNADHSVDNSTISEMSQVISALSQLGTTHNLANQAYKAIGQSVSNNLKKLNISIEGKDSEKIYYILGKELCKSFIEGKGWEDISLARAYLELVLKEFRQNYDEYKIVYDNNEVRFKLPFDDPNIFDAFYNSFASSKNREAIKRVFPGLQSILTPSQDLITLYELDGRILKYEDLLKDETLRTRDGARVYQNAIDRLKAMDGPVDVSQIEPGDYVQLDGNVYSVQGFLGTPNNIDNTVGLSYIRNLRPQKVTKLYSEGRNLKIQNHKFVLSDNSNIRGGIVNFDMWDLDSSKLAHNLKNYLNGISTPELDVIFNEVRQRSIGKWKNDFFINKETGNYNNYNEVLKYVNDVIQDDLNMIDKDKKFMIPVSMRINPDVRSTTIESIEYTPYEIMIGSTQASAFGLKSGDTVQEILSKKSKFFRDRFSENSSTLSKSHDAYLVHPSGDHLHIIFDNGNRTQNILNNIKAVELSIDTEIEGEELYRIINNDRAYAINENTKWYRVPLGNNQTYDFVVVKSVEELNDIVKSKIYDRIIVNGLSNAELIQNLTHDELTPRDEFLINLEKINPILTEEQERSLNKIKSAKDFLNYRSIKEDTNILDRIAEKRYQSFLQYLDFIVARIPAQSMQSFMNMRLVSFINTPTNSAFVPSFQYWVQGSDLDIDKGFILGSSISDSGYYNDWGIFNYTSKQTVDASNELPIPDGIFRSFTMEVTHGHGLTENSREINLSIDKYGNTIDIESLSNLSKANYFTNPDPKIIKNLALLINHIQESNVKSLNLSEDLIKLINLHTTDSITRDKNRLNNALKNKIWFLIKQNGQSIKNVLAQMNPINLDVAAEAALSSQEGKDSNIISVSNPATTMQLQLANVIGKECISISATGSKIASAITQHFNELARVVNATSLTPNVLLLPDIKYIIDGDEGALKSKLAFTNINWENYNNLKTSKVYQDMLNQGISDDILDRISVLITISTDNAKELILQKIGATKDLMPIYVYGLLIGEDFSNISKFMIKPEIAMIQRKSSRTLLDDTKKTMDLSKAVAYYLEGVDVESFGLSSHLKGVDEWFKTLIEQSDDGSKRLIRSLVEQIITNNPEIYNQKSTFDDLIGGTGDAYTLELKKKLIKELVTQIKTSPNLTFKKSSRESKKTSKYIDPDSGFDYDQLYSEFYSDFEGDEEYMQSQRIGKIESKMLMRYLNEANTRLNDLLQFGDNLANVYQNIETLNQLKKDSANVTLLGQLLSINQGIPTKQTDRINKIFQIESTINNKIKSDEKFNLLEFFEDESRQQYWIDKFQNVKNSSFNVLDIITKSPHFYQMWKAFVTVENATNTVSLKSELTTKLAKHLKNRNIIQSKFTEKDMGKIKGFISDLVVNKFISIGLSNKIINLPSNMDVVYADTGKLVPVNRNSKQDIDLSNPYDRMSFKHWFETRYLPEMKEQYPNNQFLKALGITMYPDDFGNDYTITRLPINMLSNREADKAALNMYTNGFIEIKNIKQKMSGEYIGNENYQYTNEEIFFLYNLLVNKNKFGESSLTKIFDSSIWEYRNDNIKPDNLIIDFFVFERGLLDDPNFKFNEKEDMNYDDLELRFATRGSKSGQFYFKYDNNGNREYFDKKGQSMEVESSVLQLPMLLKMARFRGSETINDISEKLKDLIYNNKIEIKFIEC